MFESNEWSLALPELPCCGERLRYLGVPFVHKAELEHWVKRVLILCDMGPRSNTRSTLVVVVIELCIPRG